MMNRNNFYVNDNCIGCLLCVIQLPYHFKLDAKSLFAVICQQPQTSEEDQWFCELMNDCPACAISMYSA